MRCSRAVIAAGGVGSRLGKAGYGVPKGLWPMMNAYGEMQPLVDFVVEDCLAAGVTDFTFIVSEGCREFEKYYHGNEPIDRYLQARGKDELYRLVKALEGKATFRFIEQSYHPGAPYGTTVPLYLARDVVSQSGQTLYLLGDQFIHGAGSETKRLLQATDQAGTAYGMLVLSVRPQEVSVYGIAEHHNGQLQKIIEKPTVGSIDSTDANMGTFVIDSHIVPYLEANMNQVQSGKAEHNFTDVITRFANDGHQVVIARAAGTYLDCGTPENYLATMNYMASQRQV